MPSGGKVAIQMWAHVPGKVDTTPITRSIVKALYAELKIVENMMGTFTRTWSAKSKPDWNTELEEFGQDIALALWTGSTPFVWVDAGTPVGYVAFSKDYRPKTKPRSLGSGAGSGRVVRRGGGAPRTSGVEKREATWEAAERRQKVFPAKIQRAVTAGSKRVFSGQKIIRIA
jgi:hypothetical protein